MKKEKELRVDSSAVLQAVKHVTAVHTVLRPSRQALHLWAEDTDSRPKWAETCCHTKHLTLFVHQFESGIEP